MIFGIGGAIGGFGSGRAEFQAGEGGVVVGVSVDGHQWAWGDEGDHGGAVEFAIDSGDDAVVELVNEVGVGRGDAGGFDGGVEGGLDGADAGLPVVIVEGPSETFQADAGDGDSNARVGGGGEIGFDAAFGDANQSDSGWVDVIAGVEVVNEAHDVPDGFIIEGVAALALPGAEDGVG